MKNETGKSISQIKIEEINKIEGFDPAEFAIDYTDLADKTIHKRIPVAVQMAWFRMKYPMGKIATSVERVNEYFVAKARIYVDYRDSVDAYLAEATASRRKSEENPQISAREWAQTAAIGVALRNAGFGLQFRLVGDISEEEYKELDEKGVATSEDIKENGGTDSGANNLQADESGSGGVNIDDELPLEERYKQAIQVPCPVSKFSGKTLGEVLSLDPHLIKWLAEKYVKDMNIKKAAEVICDYALKGAA